VTGGSVAGADPACRAYGGGQVDSELASGGGSQDQRGRAPRELPSGTVTFLFTDLEGSTRRWEADPDGMAAAVARHLELLERAVDEHGGVVFAEMGDGIAAAFGTARDALVAAVDAQRVLEAEDWGGVGPLRARMGLHSGEGRVVGTQYESHTPNRCARLMGAAHGGQLLVSGSTHELLRGALPADVELLDLGEHRLRDLRSPMHVFQVRAPGFATSSRSASARSARCWCSTTSSRSPRPRRPWRTCCGAAWG